MKCRIYLPSQPAEPNLPIIATYPMQKITTDLFDLQGKPYLVISDVYSGMIWAEKVHNQTSAAVIKVLVKLFQNLGFCNQLISDNGPAYSSAEFEQFVKEHGIIHETSSPKHPSSNPAEPQVKNAKRIAQKTGSVQEFQAQLAKFRNIPRQDRVAPSKLFFNRELRDPNLPTLIENKLLLSEEAAKRQISKLKNCKKADFRAELPKLDPGTLVLLQDSESGLWDQSGRVVSLHNTKERSYWIKRHGKKQLIRRNRVLLRPIKKLEVEDQCPPGDNPTSSFKRPCSTPSKIEDAPELRRSARLALKCKPEAE